MSLRSCVFKMMAVNNPKGRLKEFLERRGRSLLDVVKEEHRMGPDHEARFAVDLSIDDHTGYSEYHTTKMAAEQDAAAKLLDRLQSNQPANALQGVAERAVKGDAVLRLILVDYFMSTNPGITKGQLDDHVKEYSTNRFLRENFRRLDDECTANDQIDSKNILLPHLYRLGPQLPWATDQDKLDPTIFEAWIADRFEYNSQCILSTKYDVLPALGIQP